MKPRAAVTNGSRALLSDGRSAGARRYRDLLRSFADEAGGLPGLAASSEQIVRRLAQISVELELLEARRAEGQDIDPIAYCTLMNSQQRLLRSFEALKRQRKAVGPNSPALRDYLASRVKPTREAPYDSGEGGESL
jgi:hypothetical protein